MALDAQSRRALRSIQRCLASSIPYEMMATADRNDAQAWAGLAMLEMRMLLARGQTHQARQIAERLSHAAAAGLPVESYRRREIQLLINAIDSVQAGRHFLSLHQLELAVTSQKETIQWAAAMWNARSLARVDDLDGATQAVMRSLEVARGLYPDARLWSACCAAELQARTGEAIEAELAVLRVVSHFVSMGEARGVSFAYLSLARIHDAAGAQEESEAAAEMAYNKDGSWTGPVMWLARMALRRGDVARAVQLLRSIPNPTADAYGLILALTLIEQRDISLDAVLTNLTLAEAPAANGAVGELQELLERYPQFTPARETLAWKFLSLGRAGEALEQLKVMVDESADGQSIAAIRFGLQIHEELYAEAEAEFEPERTPTAAFEGETTPTAGEVERQQKPTTEAMRVEVPIEEDRQKKPTDEVESLKTKTPTAEIEEPFADIPLGRANKRSGFAGPISLFGVPDLLQFFCNSRRTGVIEFSSQQGDARIRLHEGSICWAVSPSYPRVSRFLHDKEVVSAEQLESLADERLDTSIGQLVERDRVDVDKIREALREQIHLSIKELVDWLDGWFVFDSVRDPGVPRPELMFSAQGILLDVLREIDEANR